MWQVKWYMFIRSFIHCTIYSSWGAITFLSHVIKWITLIITRHRNKAHGVNTCCMKKLKSTWTQTGTWSELECGFGVFSRWFGWLDGGENLLGILRVIQASFPEGLFNTHSWIRHNLENTQGKYWVNAFGKLSEIFIVYTWKCTFSCVRDFLWASVMQ